MTPQVNLIGTKNPTGEPFYWSYPINRTRDRTVGFSYSWDLSGEDAIASVKGYNSAPKEVVLNEVEKEHVPEEVVTEILVWRSLFL